MPPPQESPFSTVSNIQPDITNPASSTNQDPNAVPEQNYSHEQVPFMEDQTFPYLSQPWQLEMMNPPYSNQSFPPVPHQDARNEMSESTQIQVAGGLPSSNYAGFDDTMQQTNSDQPASDGMHRSGMNTTPHWSEISDGWTNAIPADARNNLMTTSPMTLETGMQGPPSMNQPPVYSAIPNGGEMLERAAFAAQQRHSSGYDRYEADTCSPPSYPHLQRSVSLCTLPTLLRASPHPDNNKSTSAARLI